MVGLTVGSRNHHPCLLGYSPSTGKQLRSWTSGNRAFHPSIPHPPSPHPHFLPRSPPWRQHLLPRLPGPAQHFEEPHTGHFTNTYKIISLYPAPKKPDLLPSNLHLLLRTTTPLPVSARRCLLLSDPSLDDTVNAKLCSDWNVLIISLAYPKAPTVRYPVPTQQLVATILSIFADDSLPFDRPRVAIGGYSAGGQLALSSCLDPQLKGKIHAVKPFYPVTDFTISAAERKDTRPYGYKGEVDKLLKIVPLSIYSYVSCRTGLASG